MCGAVQVLVAALGIVICYADRSNMSTAILPMSEAYHWDKVGAAGPGRRKAAPLHAHMMFHATKRKHEPDVLFQSCAIICTLLCVELWLDGS